MVIKLTSSNISVVTIALLTLGLQMQSLPPFKRVQPQSSSQESVCVCVCDQLWRVTAAGGEDRAESDKRLIGLRGEQLGVFLFERHVL